MIVSGILQGWNLFAIFAATILAIILQPMDIGACALLSLSVTMFFQGMLKRMDELSYLKQKCRA
jgi:di/tricarboxylate transporter